MRTTALTLRGWVIELRVWLDRNGVLRFAGLIKKEGS